MTLYVEIPLETLPTLNTRISWPPRTVAQSAKITNLFEVKMFRQSKAPFSNELTQPTKSYICTIELVIKNVKLHFNWQIKTNKSNERQLQFVLNKFLLILQYKAWLSRFLCTSKFSWKTFIEQYRSSLNKNTVAYSKTKNLKYTSAVFAEFIS